MITAERLHRWRFAGRASRAVYEDEYAWSALPSQELKCAGCIIIIVDVSMHVAHYAVMSKLQSYLEAQNMTQQAFAAKIAVDQSVVSRLARGLMKPRLRLAVSIERATNGYVPVGAWVDEANPTPPSKSAAG